MEQVGVPLLDQTHLARWYSIASDLSSGLVAMGGAQGDLAVFKVGAGRDTDLEVEDEEVGTVLTPPLSWKHSNQWVAEVCFCGTSGPANPSSSSSSSSSSSLSSAGNSGSRLLRSVVGEYTCTARLLPSTSHVS